MKKLLLFASLMLSLLSTEAYGDGVSYIKRSVTGEGTATQVTETTETCTEYTLLTGESQNKETWFTHGGWFVVQGDVTYNGDLCFQGIDPYIILCDGASLTVNGSIRIQTNYKTITIYGQANNTGMLVAKSPKYELSGIGGPGAYTNLIIHGGTIQAFGYKKGQNDTTWGCPAIGVQQLTVLGGIVYAEGGGCSAGIGNSVRQSEIAGFLKIYGGTVTAYGGMHSPGISADPRCCGPVYIYGGTVWAYGGEQGAGIGGGYYGNDLTGDQTQDINIYGGTVRANGGLEGAGIGGGISGNGGKVNIYGGTVIAYGNKGGAGIGGGEKGKGGNVTIEGGTVTASAGQQTGNGHRAIGPGEDSEDYGQLTIGDKMTVWAGTDDTYAGRRFAKDERQGACWYSPYAKIAECDHASYTYTVSGTYETDTHTKHCRYCSFAYEPEQHSFVDGNCTVCGVGTTTHTVTIYLPKDNTNTGVYEKKYEYKIATNKLDLPASPVKVDGMEFEGWLVGIASNGSYAKALNETLYAEGTTYTIDADVSLTARYKELNISLSDDENNIQNAIALLRYNGMVASSVTLTGRTLYKDGDWNTLCLPFDVTVSDSPLSGDGVKVMELDAEKTTFDNTNLLTVHFEPITGDVLKAGVPYIIKWDNTDENIESPVFTNVKMESTPPVEVAFDGGTFVGNFWPIDIDEDNINEIIYLGAGNTLGYADEPRMLRSFRAHFVVPSVNGTRAMTRSIIYFGDETTGIVDVEANSQRSNSQLSGWYTIDGRRLSGEPAAKGVYINNGRKVVIK